MAFGAATSGLANHRVAGPSTVAGYSPSIVVTIGDLLNLTDQKRTSPAVRGAGAKGGHPPPPHRESPSAPASRSISHSPSTATSARSPRASFSERRSRAREALVFLVEWVAEIGRAHV